MMHATGQFTGKSWDEKPFSEVEGGQKLTHVAVTNAYHGDIEGDGTLEYLMVYLPDGSARYMGLERIVGRIGDRRGSFVVQHTGIFAGDAARTSLSIVSDSGTGDLRNLRGAGSFTAYHGQSGAEYTLEYEM
ncbi:MAG: DUF3224 domain-containing protein [Anaerolineae bacterium]